MSSVASTPVSSVRAKGRKSAVSISDSYKRSPRVRTLAEVGDSRVVLWKDGSQQRFDVFTLLFAAAALTALVLAGYAVLQIGSRTASSLQSPEEVALQLETLQTLVARQRDAVHGELLRVQHNASQQLLDVRSSAHADTLKTTRMIDELKQDAQKRLNEFEAAISKLRDQSDAANEKTRALLEQASADNARREKELLAQIEAKDNKLTVAVRDAAKASKDDTQRLVDEANKRLLRAVDDASSATRSEMQEILKRLDAVTAALDAERSERTKLQASLASVVEGAAARGGVDVAAVESTVQALFEAERDKSRRRDYIKDVVESLSSGTRGAPSTIKKLGLKNVLGFSLSEPPGPSAAVGADATKCWPFEGDKGQLVVELFSSIEVGAVAIEHLKADISHAPREFEVLVFPEGDNAVAPSSIEEGWQSVGKFSFEIDSVFHVFEIPKAAVSKYVMFRILSNQGGDYTCVYRVRVFKKD